MTEADPKPHRNFRQALKDSLPWPDTLAPEELYSRQHDDTDGDAAGILGVMFDHQGDAYVSMDVPRWLRFRTGEFGGGGRSPRTRAALLVLADAIRLDNLEKPADIREPKKCNHVVGVEDTDMGGRIVFASDTVSEKEADEFGDEFHRHDYCPACGFPLDRVHYNRTRPDNHG